MFRLYCGFIRLCVAKNDFNKVYKTLGELASDGTNDLVGGGASAQNDSRFSAMAMDGDDRWRDHVDMRVR